MYPKHFSRHFITFGEHCWVIVCVRSTSVPLARSFTHSLTQNFAFAHDNSALGIVYKNFSFSGNCIFPALWNVCRRLSPYPHCNFLLFQIYRTRENTHTHTVFSLLLKWKMLKHKRRLLRTGCVYVYTDWHLCCSCVGMFQAEPFRTLFWIRE